MSFIRNACLMVIVLLALLGVAAPAQAQSCSNPAGVAGDMIYNASDDVFQGCTPSGWMAFHQIPPDPCTVSGTPGTPCADGQTVYAGSWNGSRYYTTVADQTAGPRYGTHNVLLGVNAQSVSDGWTNTNTALASIDANPQAGGCSAAPYNPPACALNAPVLCRDLRTTLGGDWYVPARDELVNVLHANKDLIGGFTGSTYWSSTELSSTRTQLVNFPAGTLNPFSDKYTLAWLRCVKRG